MSVLADIAFGFSAVGLAQAGAGLAGLRRLSLGPAAPALHPPVTILKPLMGGEPLLEAALTSFFALSYPDYQLVFGVQDAADPAIGVVRRLQRLFPARDVALVIDPTPHGGNGKVANLINMLPVARHDLLILADSDVHVPPSFVERMIAGLDDPKVGVVTALYTGVAGAPGLPAKLGAAHINHVFVPGALAGRMVGRQDCLGAAVAIRRETLARIGGLPALLPHLADDAVLGRLVRRLGLRVALAPMIVKTTVAERTLPALIGHELRWARTIRSLTPLVYTTSLLQYPLVWSLLAFILSGGKLWALAGLVLVWLLRLDLSRRISRQLVQDRLPLWLLPLREVLSIAIVLASYLGNRVVWRGATLRAEAQGSRLRADARADDRPVRGRAWLGFRRGGTNSLPRGINPS